MAPETALIEQVEASLSKFREANDELLKTKADRGYVDQALQEKVDALNSDVTAAMDAVRQRQDELEARANREEMFGGGRSEKQDELLKAAASFGRMVGQELSVEDYGAVLKAQEHYLRYGKRGMDSKMQAALNVADDSQGGYFVTPDRGGRIATLVYETSPIRQIASVETIGTDALEGPRDLDQAATGGWVGETASRTETNTPEIGEYRIPVHEQYAAPQSTQKMLDDADRDVGAWLERKIANRLARAENTAFVSGNGVARPRGFTTYGHGTPSATTYEVIQRVATGAAGGFDTGDSPPIGGDCLVDLVFALKSQYRANARFVMARLTLAEVRKLKDGEGNYLWQPDFTQRQSGMLLGYPVTEAEDMPAIAANSLSIGFGDFMEAYTVVDHRTGLRILRDPYTAKPYVVFYATKRVGGDVVNFEAIKLLRFATATE